MKRTMRRMFTKRGKVFRIVEKMPKLEQVDTIEALVDNILIDRHLKYRPGRKPNAVKGFL